MGKLEEGTESVLLQWGGWDMTQGPFCWERGTQSQFNSREGGGRRSVGSGEMKLCPFFGEGLQGTDLEGG